MSFIIHYTCNQIQCKLNLSMTDCMSCFAKVQSSCPSAAENWRTWSLFACETDPMVCVTVYSLGEAARFGLKYINDLIFK